ncbi:MAG: DUF4258 domain-containing protein [Gammaproteobacteria bacterium]|nr:DUF4258 domain-containing protein [Gammaproteobacteria bacterium]
MPGGQIKKLDLTKPRAIEICKDKSKKVFFTDHALERMRQRKLTRSQVERCIRTGALIEGPSIGSKGEWECKFELFTAGDKIAVVVGLLYEDPGKRILVITTISLN